MWVKICANTCLEDALAAAEFGADALGFVFAPSRRQVDAEQVRAITRQLPASIETVGVFAGSDAAAIAATAIAAGLQTIQLHGGLDIGLAERLRQCLGPETTIIHTAHWTLDPGAAAAGHVSAAIAQAAVLPDHPRLLIDTRVAGNSGGLGVSFNWEEARPAFASAHGLNLRLIVAGGLRPDNVAEAARTLRPWGVDVASGVEREAGRKDLGLLRLFIENAKVA